MTPGHRTHPHGRALEGLARPKLAAFREFRYPTAPVVVVVKASHRSRVARTVGYTATPDATIGGSRSGHAPLVLWYAIRTHGLDGLRRRAEAARELAAYTRQRLDELGWVAYRHEHAFTVVLRTPPEAVVKKWVLASSNGWSHIITMPGTTADLIDAFLADLRAAVSIPLPDLPRIPAPPSPQPTTTALA